MIQYQETFLNLDKSAAFRELNLDSSYIGYRIPKGELESGIQGLK